MKKLNIAFDVDDTLNKFTEEVLVWCERKFGIKLQFEDVEWGFENFPKEVTTYAHELFRSEEFIESVPWLEGVIEMLEELTRRGHNVVFPTSTYSAVMSKRALGLFETIPFIHPRNYILTGRKDLVKTDLLFDDCFSHIAASISDIPVLVNKPWNRGNTGYIRCNSTPADYLKIIGMAEEGYNRQDIYKEINPTAETAGPYVIILVGGSGTGKSTILGRILEVDGDFCNVVTNTTRKPRQGEQNGVDYYFRTEEEFQKMISSGKMVEYTKYANNYYGTSREPIDAILASGKNAIIIMDVEGVKHMREMYPDRTYAILLQRDQKELIRSVLERSVPMEEKIARIAQLDGESRSSLQYCNYKVLNEEIGQTAEEIIKIFKG